MQLLELMPHTLDIKNGLLFTKGGASLQLHRRDSALSGRVFTVGHRSIPPYSEDVLHCSVRSTGLIVGRTLVDPSKWQIPVLVSNFSQENIVVDPFTEVGMITQVTAIQCVTEPPQQSHSATGALPHRLAAVLLGVFRYISGVRRPSHRSYGRSGT